jgi:hypothetical protein
MAAALHTRIPAGHPEGFIEALPTFTGTFAYISEPWRKDFKCQQQLTTLAFMRVRGMKFLEAAVASSRTVHF